MLICAVADKSYMNGKPGNDSATPDSVKLFEIYQRFLKNYSHPHTEYLLLETSIIAQLPVELQRTIQPFLFDLNTYQFETINDPSYLKLLNEVHVHRRQAQMVLTWFADTIAAQKEVLAFSNLVTSEKLTALKDVAFDAIQACFTSPNEINLGKAKKLTAEFVHSLVRLNDARTFLESLSQHDNYTFRHSIGTAVLSIMIARRAGIVDETYLKEIALGGILHDIGKSKVPTAIINKPGPLDADEWAHMQKHVEFGHEIVSQTDAIGKIAKLCILQHHEDPTGSGYPSGLRSKDTSEGAKIVAVSDVFHSLTSDRAYSQAKTTLQALEFMRNHCLQRLEKRFFESLILVFAGK